MQHLFRHEAGRMLSALLRVFSVHNMELAEDAVQDTLLRALETWKLRGLPHDPRAWLIRAARNRAVDVIRRERTARRFAPDEAASSPYHLEAAIAALHAFAPSYADTDWRTIESLYGKLFQLRPTPVVALGRAIARGEAHGPAEGLRALDAIDDRERLESQPFLFAARAQYLRALGRVDEARAALRQAREAARTDAERLFIDVQLARDDAGVTRVKAGGS